METKDLAKPSKENAVSAAKKLYTKPLLKKYGAVSELTSGGGCSPGKNHHDWNHARKPWCW